MQKYRAKPTVVDNVRFSSKKEASHYLDLKLLEQSKVINDLVLQPRFKIVINDIHVCDVVSDFSYWNILDRRRVVIDVKGMKKGSAYQMFRLKAKLVKACYGIEIEEV